MAFSIKSRLYLDRFVRSLSVSIRTYKFINFTEASQLGGDSLIKFEHKDPFLESPLYNHVPILKSINRNLTNNHYLLTLRNAKILFIRLGNHLLSSSDTRVEIILGDHVVVSDPMGYLYYSMLTEKYGYYSANSSSVGLDLEKYPTVSIEKLEFFGAGRANYGHFIFDFLPNIILNNDKLVTYLRTESSQESILNIFGVNSRFGVSYATSILLLVESLTISSTFPYCNLSPFYAARVSRGHPSNRHGRLALFKTAGNGSRIKNFDEVTSLLVDKGFEVLDPLSVSFNLLIEKLSGCSCLVVSQDASSANSLFIPVTSRVIFLTNTAYLQSDRLDLQFSLIGLTSVQNLVVIDGPQAEDGIPGWARFLVPLDRLAAAV
jgi:hypothetical protein